MKSAAFMIGLALLAAPAVARPLPQRSRRCPQDAIAKPLTGTCPWGWTASGSFSTQRKQSLGRPRSAWLASQRPAHGAQSKLGLTDDAVSPFDEGQRP
jgi:hypothetical protein